MQLFTINKETFRTQEKKNYHFLILKINEKERINHRQDFMFKSFVLLSLTVLLPLHSVLWFLFL